MTTTSRRRSVDLSGGAIDMAERLLKLRNTRSLSGSELERLRANVDVLHDTLTDQRPARVAVVGYRRSPLSGLLDVMLGSSSASINRQVREHLGRGRWYDYRSGKGAVRVLDVRMDAGNAEPVCLKAVERERPDAVVVLCEVEDVEDKIFVTRIDDFFRQLRSIYGVAPPVLLTLLGPRSTSVRVGQAVEELWGRTDIPEHKLHVAYLRRTDDFMCRLIRQLPLDTRYNLAAATGVTQAKRETAEDLVRSCSGITGVIATMPIPLADIIPITSLQMTMVGAIANLSGRAWNVRTGTEFAVAMGINVGAGFAFRHVARQAVRVVPFAGSVVSAGITSAATYGLGRAAMRYFLGED